MQITVFGASGKVGSLVVEEALRRGYTVVAFVHSHNLFSPSGKLIVIQGDIHNAADVASALRGSEAVISCLGSWGTPKKDVLTAAMQAIIPAMAEQNIPRIVTLTGSGAQAPDVAPGSGHTLFMKLLAPFPAGKVFADGEQHMRMLAQSTLDWTTIRSPVMTGGNDTAYVLSLAAGSPLAAISRQAVVAAMLDQLGSGTWLRQAPIIHLK